MVTLTRITGTQFALNPDLIERIDRTPDTVITLVDGTKYLVQESLDEVVLIVADYRAQIVAAAGTFERAGENVWRRSRLSAVPSTKERGIPQERRPADEREPGDGPDQDGTDVVPIGNGSGKRGGQ